MNLLKGTRETFNSDMSTFNRKIVKPYQIWTMDLKNSVLVMNNHIWKVLKCYLPQLYFYSFIDIHTYVNWSTVSYFPPLKRTLIIDDLGIFVLFIIKFHFKRVWLVR